MINKKLLFLLILIGSLFSFVLAEGTRTTWNNKVKPDEDGWSNWQYVEDLNQIQEEIYQYAVVWVPVEQWGDEYGDGSHMNEIKEIGVESGTTSSFCRWNSRTKATKWYEKDEGGTEWYYCNVSGRPDGRDCGSTHSGYSCDYDGSTTGYCGKGFSVSVACNDAAEGEWVGGPGMSESSCKTGFTACRFWRCSRTTDPQCTSSGSTSTDNGCGVADRNYYYRNSVSFKDPTKFENWRSSLSACVSSIGSTSVSGFGKKIYIYSYKERIFLKYDGNGANGICKNWATGSNKYNSNASILYLKGNPQCQVDFTSGSMESASSEQYYVNYYAGKNYGNYYLHENQYYRTGYDFKGWSFTSNGSVVFTDKQKVSGEADFPGKKPGSEVTLYAVWEKHNYDITYKYMCGNGSALTKQYQYQTGLTLQDLVVTNNSKDSSSVACNTVSGTGGNNSTTEFIDWYEDSNYLKRITEIPASYHEDITLWAKLRQKRVYIYGDESGQWKFCNSSVKCN